MTTDAHFREEVRRQAIACGHSAAVADALARRVGKNHKDTTTRPSYPKGSAPRAFAATRGGVVTGASLEDFLAFVGLPKSWAARFREAGVGADAAVPLLSDYGAAKRRGSAAAAATALGLRLLSKTTFKRTTK
jgi:hypothetical protein